MGSTPMSRERIRIHDIKRARDLIESVGAEVATERKPGEEARRKGRILVVEDDESIRDLLRRALTHRGYEVETAIDGWTALTGMRARKFDLALVDVMLPRVDGFSRVRRIRGYPRLAGVPVVFVRTRQNPQSITTGIALGACSYVTRPFDLGALLAEIEVALSQSAAA